MYFKVEKGHHGNACIFMRTFSKDKAQILQVSVSHVEGTAHTTEAVAQHVADEMSASWPTTPHYVKDLDDETKKEIRETAASLREDFLKASSG